MGTAVGICGQPRQRPLPHRLSYRRVREVVEAGTSIYEVNAGRPYTGGRRVAWCKE